MTRAQHISAARRFGGIAYKIAADGPRLTQKAQIAAEINAILAWHHARMAQACPADCNNGMLHQPPYGFVRCDACRGRGWMPTGVKGEAE